MSTYRRLLSNATNRRQGIRGRHYVNKTYYTEDSYSEPLYLKNIKKY